MVVVLTGLHCNGVIIITHTESSSTPPAVPSERVSPDGRSKIFPTFTDADITADCDGWQPIIYVEIKAKEKISFWVNEKCFEGRTKINSTYMYWWSGLVLKYCCLFTNVFVTINFSFFNIIAIIIIIIIIIIRRRRESRWLVQKIFFGPLGRHWLLRQKQHWIWCQQLGMVLN